MTEAELHEAAGEPYSQNWDGATAELTRRTMSRLPMFHYPPITYARKRELVRYRQEARRMESAGYRRHETDWEIVRGARQSEVIVDAVISRDGKSVWTKLGVSVANPR